MAILAKTVTSENIVQWNEAIFKPFKNSLKWFIVNFSYMWELSSDTVAV